MIAIARILLLSALVAPAFAGNTGSMVYAPASAAAVPVMTPLTTALLGLFLLIVAYRVLRVRISSSLSLLAAALIAGSVTLGGNQLISSAVANSEANTPLANPNGGTVPVYGSITNTYPNTSGVSLSIGTVTLPNQECVYPTGAADECRMGSIVAPDSYCQINCLAPSDARLKHDIRYLTSTDQGIKLYAFKYLWSEQVYVGVMAQDLLQSERYRGAVTQMPGGYYAVDYGQIGVAMTTLENW